MYGMSAKERLAMFQSKASGDDKNSAPPPKKIGKLGTASSKKSTKTVETKTTTKKAVTKSEKKGEAEPTVETTTTSKTKVTTSEHKGDEAPIVETKTTSKTETTKPKEEAKVETKTTSKTETTKPKVEAKVETKTETKKSETKSGGASTVETKVTTKMDSTKSEKKTQEVPSVEVSTNISSASGSKGPTTKVVKTEEKSDKDGVTKTKVTEQTVTKSQDGITTTKREVTTTKQVTETKGVSPSPISHLTPSSPLGGGESDLDLDSEFEANIAFVSDAESIMADAKKSSLQTKKQRAESSKPKQADPKPKAVPQSKEEAKPPVPPIKENKAIIAEAQAPETHKTEAIKDTKEVETATVSGDAAALISHETREQVVIEGESQVEKGAAVEVVTVSESTDGGDKAMDQPAEVSIIASAEGPVVAETSETQEVLAGGLVMTVQIDTEEDVYDSEAANVEMEMEIAEVEEEKPSQTLIITSGTTPTLELTAEQGSADVTLVEEPATASGAEEVLEGGLVMSVEIDTEEDVYDGGEAKGEATFTISEADVAVDEVAVKEEVKDSVVEVEEKKGADEVAPVGVLTISAQVETEEEVYDAKEVVEKEAELVVVEEKPKKDYDAPFYPKLSHYSPLPDEFYDTIFYFSGMGRVIGSALAQGVYVNSKAAKSALDISDLEKLNAANKSQNKSEDAMKNVRHQAQDLSLDLRHLQTLMDGLPSFPDSQSNSGDVHLVFKQPQKGGRFRSRSQPPVRQAEPVLLPWETRTTGVSVAFPHKVPVMPGMPEYPAAQAGWYQAPPKPAPAPAVSKPAQEPSVPEVDEKAEVSEPSSTKAVPVTPAQDEALVTEQVITPSSAPTAETVPPVPDMPEPVSEPTSPTTLTPMVNGTGPEPVAVAEEHITPFSAPIAKTAPPAPLLPQLQARPPPPPPKPPVSLGAVMSQTPPPTPKSSAPSKPVPALQQSLTDFQGGPIAPQQNQPKQGGARLFGVHSGEIQLDSQPWQGRVGVNTNVPKFTTPTPFSPSGSGSTAPSATWQVSHAPATAEAPRFSSVRPPTQQLPSPSTPTQGTMQIDFQLDPVPRPSDVGVTFRASATQPSAASDRENHVADASSKRISTSGLKPWQLSRIRALEARGILVRNEDSEDHSEATYRLAHSTENQRQKGPTRSVTTYYDDSTTGGQSQAEVPVFYGPTEQRAVRSVAFNPLKGKSYHSSTRVVAGCSDL